MQLTRLYTSFSFQAYFIPLASFLQDTNETVMGVMQNHLVYRKELADRKIVVVFGPVADPKETYGLAIVEAEYGAVAHEFGIRDPSISMVLYRLQKILQVF
jgi:uncharacterized protein YciI